MPDEPSPKQRAIDLIVQYGGIDGAHHKDWVLDQVVRILTDCPEEPFILHGNEYTRLGESEEYQRIIADACDGEDGPETYSWEVGIAP